MILKAASEVGDGRSCLVTGGNGYLGKHVVNHLVKVGWKVKTLGRGDNNSYVVDLQTDHVEFNEAFDVVIHCAGKAHSFPNGAVEEQQFFNINVKGTQALLNAIDQGPTLPKSFVFMSSVSVYGADEGSAITEDAALNSSQPYGLSKIAAEKMISAWCKKRNVICLILRLPLLAGVTPPGNLATMIAAIQKGYYLNIGTEVRKSIVMAEDVAKLIPSASLLGGIYNLTDGEHPRVRELAQLIAMQLGRKSPLTIPVWMSKVMLFMADKLSFLSRTESYKLKKLSTSLTFDDSKARRDLAWKPTKVLAQFKIK